MTKIAELFEDEPISFMDVRIPYSGTVRGPVASLDDGDFIRVAYIPGDGKSWMELLAALSNMVLENRWVIDCLVILLPKSHYEDLEKFAVSLEGVDIDQEGIWINFGVNIFVSYTHIDKVIVDGLPIKIEK